MRRPALIVIDMQNDFLEKWPPVSKKQIIGSINELVALLRFQGHPIVWVRQEFEPDLHDAFPQMKAKGIWITIKGTPGCQMDPGLAVTPTDIMIVKKRYSAFFGTNLDQILDQQQPDALILAGINTHACIRTTAIDACQRDREVILAADCVGSYDREHHEISLRYMKDKIASLMTNDEIRAALAATL